MGSTSSKHALPIYGNLIKDRWITSINPVWLADITYICIRNGFGYMTALLDVFSRKVIGYAISKSMDTGLVLKALKMDMANRNSGIWVIHHSDRGVQYASLEYTRELKDHGFQISMSGKGNPYDNATMESFLKTRKHEEVYLFGYENLSAVQSRLHSSIGYVSPVEYEALIQQQQNKEETRQPVLTCSVQS